MTSGKMTNLMNLFKMPKFMGKNDGLYRCAIEGEQRQIWSRFLNAPTGAEVTGPEFTPDGTTLFVSIQHPGEGSSYHKPSTRWPDFDPLTPPKPSVIAITRKDQQPISQ